MVVRLAFAVIAHVDADVLIIDERSRWAMRSSRRSACVSSAASRNTARCCSSATMRRRSPTCANARCGWRTDRRA
jgi:hypothetical protein